MAKTNYGFEITVKISNQQVRDSLDVLSAFLNDHYQVNLKAKQLWERPEVQASLVKALKTYAEKAVSELHDAYGPISVRDVNIEKLFKADIKAAWEKIEAEEAAERAREEAEEEKRQRNMPKNLQVGPDDYRKAIELLEAAGINVKPLSAHPDWPFPTGDK